MMNPFARRRLLAAAALSALPVLAARAQTSHWPARPIQLVHGFGAGGNADTVARLLGKKLQQELGQSVVIDIKSGAGGSIASHMVAKAAPDGYSLVMLTGGHTVSAALRKNLPYDAINDFAFISTVTSFPFVVAVRAAHPAQTLAQLLEMARQGQPVSFSSVGVGSTQHMVGELLAATANAPLLHIPYRGGGAPVQAVLAGEVDVLCDTPTVATPHIKAGKLRALAVTSAQAWPTLAQVPPVSATLAGFEVRSWLGLAAPAGTPEAIIARLNAAVRNAVQASDMQQALTNAGSMATHSTAQAMREMIARDIARWKDVIARRGIKVD